MSSEQTTIKHVDDLNDPVLRRLADEYDHWLSGVRWALGDVSKQDLEMMIADFGGDNVAPGPERRTIMMARRLMEYAR